MDKKHACMSLLLTQLNSTLKQWNIGKNTNLYLSFIMAMPTVKNLITARRSDLASPSVMHAPDSNIMAEGEKKNIRHISFFIKGNKIWTIQQKLKKLKMIIIILRHEEVPQIQNLRFHSRKLCGAGLRALCYNKTMRWNNLCGGFHNIVC